MSFEVILLVAGVLLLLLGLIGHIKVKEIELGTNNTIIRVVVSIIGISLLILSFNPDVLRSKVNQSAPINPTSAAVAQTNAEAAQAKAEAEAAQAKAEAAQSNAEAAQAKAEAEAAQAKAEAAQANAEAAQAKAEAEAAQAKAEAEAARAKAEAEAAAALETDANNQKLYPRTGLPCSASMQALCTKYGATSCMTIEAIDNAVSDICRWDRVDNSKDCGDTAGLWATPKTRFALRHPGTVRAGESGSCTTQAKNLANKKYFRDNNKIMK